MDSNKYLLVIVGPTAVGKTELCIDLAKHLNTEIISADSRQFYKEMTVGTAKPTASELKEVPHHLINNLSIQASYDIGKYEKEALMTIEYIFTHKNTAILTGGSGLYIDAVCKGVDEMPMITPAIRNTLNERYEREGLGSLIEKLKLVDNEYYKQVDLHNPQRVIRALEVYEATGQPYSSFRKSTDKIRPFKIIKIGLERDREELYSRIDQRMDVMISEGLFEEAKALYSFRSNNALQTVGYKEIFEYLDGEYDREEAIRLLKRNSRRYAKRQMTWFRKDENIKWFHPDNKTSIIDYVQGQIV